MQACTPVSMSNWRLRRFCLREARSCGIFSELRFTRSLEKAHMENRNHVYRLKVDSSGRLLLPTEVRDRHRISNGDTVVVLDDAEGLRLRTLDEVIADVQAHFAKHVPRGVLLSEEILADRRAEHERD